MKRSQWRFNSYKYVAWSVFLGLVLLLGACSATPSAENELSSLTIARVPLSQIPVPRPQTSDIIDQAAAVRLGKALFWDIQVGSDGQTACATCHFQAGTDARKTNAVNPGPDGKYQLVTEPGKPLALSTYFSNDDIVGSQGVVAATFTAFSSNVDVAADSCTSNGFHRQVTGRQAPTVIGAVFNRFQFWDGRASNVFNGVNPFGNTGNNSSTPLTLMTNSSLASQAVGPVNNIVEMACNGRTFNGPNSVATKLLPRRALAKQKVASDDSVLGSYANTLGNGLTLTYQQMINAAFSPAVALDATNQFSNIFGQAIQAYESTLIPDRTPFDRYLAGNKNALTFSQQAGLVVFNTKGGCTECHESTEMSDATVSYFEREGAVDEDGGDSGFHNVGSTPTANDLGRAGLGPNGVPWAQTTSVKNRGAFKTPQLRNVKLTAPYFVRGNVATLADVVKFYNQAGFFKNPEKSSELEPLNLNTLDQAFLVDFLTNALTDCRVEKRAAPFDHPALPLPNSAGVSGVSNGVLPATGRNGTGPCN
jgi:cytochrome c peroxidase